MNTHSLKQGKILLFFLLILLCVPCCSGDKKEKERPVSRSIHIGIAIPFTHSSLCDPGLVRKAADLRIAEVNESGGIDGWTLKALYEDDMSDPARAASIALKFSTDINIPAVVGHFSSDCSLAAKPIYKQYGLTAISPASTHPGVTSDCGCFFRVVYDDNSQGEQLAQYVSTKMGIRDVIVVYDRKGYGKRLKDAFVREFVSSGKNKVMAIDFTRGQGDFSDIRASLRDNNPELLFIAGFHKDGGRIIRFIREAGITTPIIGGDGLYHKDFISIAGKKNGEGVHVASPFLFELGSKRTREFTKRFSSRYGVKPDMWSALMYDSIGIVIKAIKRAGTLRSAITRELSQWNTPDEAYHGVTGDIYFDAEGNARRKIQISVIRGGEFHAASQQL